MELARTDVFERVEELRSAKKQLPEYEYHLKKDNLLQRLQRLQPGGQKSLSVMTSDDGALVTAEPSEMAELLATHWGRVFKRKQVDMSDLPEWIDKFAVKFSCVGCDANNECWTLKRGHVVDSIRNAHESSPGGIPYKACKIIEDLAGDVLLQAALALQEPGALDSLPDDFNATYLVCLPKKASGVHPELGEYYKASSTRPLSLINTDNRLLANSYRNLLEPVADLIVSKMQQGFLKGRQIVRNAIDIDTESMIASFQHNRAALILFHLLAAFHSKSQKFVV